MTLPGGWEWLVILAIVLLLVGGRRLPDLAGSIGRSIRELRRATTEDDADDASARTEGRAGSR